MAPLASARVPAKATRSSGTRLIVCPPIRLWQRLRRVAESAQIGEQGCPVLRLRQPREGHLGAGRIVLRLGQELVEVLKGPLPAQALDRVGVAEVVEMSLLVADDVPQVGADLVRAALAEVVAGLALAGDLLAIG